MRMTRSTFGRLISVRRMKATCCSTLGVEVMPASSGWSTLWRGWPSWWWCAYYPQLCDPTAPPGRYAWRYWPQIGDGRPSISATMSSKVLSRSVGARSLTMR